MKFTGSVSYFADGSLTAKIYYPAEKNSNYIALNIEDSDEHICVNTANVFINSKYEPNLKAAVAAFNAAWKSVEAEKLVEHE
jgi:hypothetical protein